MWKDVYLPTASAEHQVAFLDNKAIKEDGGFLVLRFLAGSKEWTGVANSMALLLYIIF